jgi:hypothetical protein
MADGFGRYFGGALAFAFVVTWAAVGPLVAVLATLLCGAIVFSPRLRRPVVTRPRKAPRPRPARHALVPDEPSLILTVSQ